MTISDDRIREANKDATLSPHRVSILYGDHGKRKTTTAASMVKNRGLLLSSDDSWKVLLNDRHKELFDKLHIITLEGLSQLDYINFEGDDKGEYDTIIWDPISKSVDDYVDLLYDEASWGGKYREKITTTNKELKNVEILSPMDYRVTRDIFRPTLNKIFRLPRHIVLTAHWNDPVRGLSVDMTRRPNIPAATFKLMAIRADVIACLRPESSKFVADLTENSIAYLGKSRIQGLEGKMPLDTFVSKYKEIVFS